MGRYTNLLVTVLAIGFLLAGIAVAMLVARTGNDYVSDMIQKDKHLGVSIEDTDVSNVENSMSSGTEVRNFIVKYGYKLPIKVCTLGCPGGTYDFTSTLDKYSDSYVSDTAKFGCVVHRDVNYNVPDALIFYQEGLNAPDFTPDDLSAAVARSADEEMLLEAQYKAYIAMCRLKEASYSQADASRYDPDVSKEWLKMQIQALRPKILEK